MFFDDLPGRLTECSSGRSWSGREIAVMVGARMHCLGSERLRRGERVFVRYGNKLEFFIDILAAWHLGASLAPIDARLTAFEVENLARAVQPRLLLVDSAADATSFSGLAALGVKIVDVRSWEIGGGNRPAAVPIRSQARLDDEALLLFTSGSTGVPKGVVHTHRSLLARWTALRDVLGLAPFRRTLCLLPTFFGHGLICNSLFPWLAGQELVIGPPFSPELLMRLGGLIDEYQITFLSSVPSMWGLALKASKPPAQRSLQRVHCGSAPLSGMLWRQIQNWAGTREVFNAYGITETGSWVAGTSVGEFTPEDGLIGLPWGAVLKILASTEPDAPFAADAGCDPGETGHVWINTPSLMQGYYGQPQATEQAVSGGWFFTGDIGLLDDRGWLYLKGREREEINKGGAKIYPADIDALVEQSELSREVCAFAVADPLYGQNVALAVVLKDESPTTIRALHEWLKPRLADFKMPSRWYTFDALPRNSRGKVSRKEIEDHCAAKQPLDLQGVLRSG